MITPEGIEEELGVFARRMGIDLSADVAAYGSPCLNEAEAFSAGADGHTYDFHQIDYMAEDGSVVASRAIADIPVHARTEPAYFTGGPVGKEEWQRIDLHRGVGELVMGTVGRDRPQIIRLDARRMPRVMLPTDVFYFLRNTLGSRARFTVSSVYEGQVDWNQLETEVGKGQMAVTPPGRGRIHIPAAFYAELRCTS